MAWPLALMKPAYFHKFICAKGCSMSFKSAFGSVSLPKAKRSGSLKRRLVLGSKPLRGESSAKYLACSQNPLPHLHQAQASKGRTFAMSTAFASGLLKIILKVTHDKRSASKARASCPTETIAIPLEGCLRPHPVYHARQRPNLG